MSIRCRYCESKFLEGASEAAIDLHESWCREQLKPEEWAAPGKIIGVVRDTDRRDRWERFFAVVVDKTLSTNRSVVIANAADYADEMLAESDKRWEVKDGGKSDPAS